MNEKNINTLLILIIIILSYMYFTKKNCLKKIEGFKEDGNKGAVVMYGASNLTKEGEEIIIDSDKTEEDKSNIISNFLSSFFYGKDNPLNKNYEIVTQVPQTVPMCKDGPCKTEDKDPSIKKCEINKDLPDKLDCECPEKTILKNFKGKKRCLNHCERINDKNGNPSYYSNLYSEDYPCGCEGGEVRLRNKNTGEVKKMCTPPIPCNMGVSPASYTSWLDANINCSYCKGGKEGDKIMLSKLVTKEINGNMKKRCEPICDKSGVNISQGCTCPDNQKLIVRGDKQFCLNKCTMDSTGKYSVALPKNYDCYCPENTVKKEQSYDGKLLTKCTPYCPGDISKGFGDYVPKEDKCACPEGSGPVINNLTGKKRCEKECKIENGKNITEWIEKGVYCKIPSTFKEDFKHRVRKQNHATKNLYRYVHEIRPGMNIDIKEKVWRMPLNMPGQVRSVAPNWQQCSTRCKNTPGCKFFNYFPNGGCHITNGAGGEKSVPNNPTKYSGETLGGNNLLTDGRVKLPIVNRGVQFRAYRGKKNIERNWEACRVRCASTPGCRSFNYMRNKSCLLTTGTRTGTHTIPEKKIRFSKRCRRYRYGFLKRKCCRTKCTRIPRVVNTGKRIQVKSKVSGSNGRDYLLLPNSLYMNRVIPPFPKRNISRNVYPFFMVLSNNRNRRISRRRSRRRFGSRLARLFSRR